MRCLAVVSVCDAPNEAISAYIRDEAGPDPGSRSPAGLMRWPPSGRGACHGVLVSTLTAPLP